MKPISSSRIVRLWASFVAFVAMACYASVSGASEFTFRDYFDGTRDPAWSFYVPYDTPTESFEPAGFWTLNMPTTTTVFDHWSSIDNAPALYLDIPSANQGDNFFIETHLVWDGPASGNFHGVIVVYFSRYNTFYWGPYMGTNLRVEKSGQNALWDVGYGTRDVYLRIERTGTTYDFLYRDDPESEWTLGGTETALGTETPTKVGLMGKTWGTLSADLILSFDYFLVNANLGADAGFDKRAYSGETVPLNGAGPSDATSFSWEQLPGEPRVTFVPDPPNQAEVTFVAPTVSAGVIVTFRLTVDSPTMGVTTDDVDVAIIPDMAPPFPVSNLRVCPIDSGLKVLWDPVLEAETYDVELEIMPGVWFAYGTNLTETVFDVGNQPLGKTYGVRVVATNSKGAGAISDAEYYTIMRNLALPAPTGATPPLPPVQGVTYVVSHYAIGGMNNGEHDDNNDSWDGTAKTQDFWGYMWDQELFLDRVVYYGGTIFWDGAWFTDLKLQYFDTVEAAWKDVSCVITPPYDYTDSPAGRDDFSRYDITFPVLRGTGIRIFGTPGGLATFTSIAELEVYGDQTRPADFIVAQGMDAEFSERTEATLDGSYSLAAAGDIVSYSWTAPAGFPYTLVGADTDTASFQAGGVDADETYVFSLTVEDSEGNTDTDDDVQITIKNLVTTAVAGADRRVTEGDEVILSGEGSLTTSDDITYHWECVSHPDFQLPEPDNAVCSFTAPPTWDYGTDMTFRLTVDDLLGQPDSVSTDEVVIKVCNSAMTSVFDLDPLGAAGWQFFGSANYDDAAGILKLTPTITYQTGAAWLNETTDCSQFSAKFKVYIGDGDGADGMVFGWVRAPAIGDTGGSLGWYGATGPSGYGIVFDTYPNPAVNLVSFEDTEVHTGVDTGGFANYTPPIDMENTGWFDVEVEMDNGHLQVWMSNEAAGFARELAIDYTLTGYQGFPAYFGFTAATGGLSNNHWVDDLPSVLPDAYAVRELPPSYQAGTTFDVKLSVRVNPDNLPDPVTIRETIPAGVSVEDYGGGTPIGNEIGWTLTGEDVGMTTIVYRLSVLGDTTGGLNFEGTVNYPGGEPDQEIYGDKVVYEVPSAPRNVGVEMFIAGHLSWSANPEEGIAGYRIYRSVDGGDWEEVAFVTGTSYIDKWLYLAPDSSYNYRVVAVNQDGVEGDPSDPTGPATITMQIIQAEDFNYGGGLGPWDPSVTIAAVEATAPDDLTGTDYYHPHDGGPNDYRPLDATPAGIGIETIEEADRPGEYHTNIGWINAGSWWRYNVDVPEAGWIKLVFRLAGPQVQCAVAAYWDEQYLGVARAPGTGSWHIFTWAVLEESIQTTTGLHVLRVEAVETDPAQIHDINFDMIGIGFNWTPPKRKALFEEDFEDWTNLYDDIDAINEGWTLEYGPSGKTDGSWRLWNTTGDLLRDTDPDIGAVTSNYIISDSDMAGDYEMNEGLITPDIDATEYTKLRLTFSKNYRIYLEDTTRTQTAEVDIRTKDPVTQMYSGWTNLLHWDLQDGVEFNMDPEVLDISAFDNNIIQIRWHYYDAQFDYWFAIDDIVVSGEKEEEVIDVEVREIAIVGGNVELSWSDFADTYYIECTDDLVSGDWSHVDGPITETSWSGDVSAICPGDVVYVRIRGE